MVTIAQEKEFIDKIKLHKFSDEEIIKKIYRKPICYKQKKNAYDMWTGEKVIPDKKKYKIIETKKRIYKKVDTNVLVLEAHNGYQFLRYFNVYTEARIGEKASISVNEVAQYIFTPNGKILLKRLRVVSFMYEWNWQWGSYLSYHNFSDRYEMYPDGIIKFSFIKSFKKVHIDRLIARYIIDYLKTILRNDHRYETLVELKHSDIAVYLLKRYSRVEIDKAWNSIRIALKNNYDFNQGGRNDSCDLWFDELNNLIELKLDTRSPKYVCPENLVEAHNQHNAQIAKIRAKKELEKQRLESVEDNIEYIKSHEKYLKKIIETDKFIIKPLKNVEEFYEEGTLMHHCLFTQKYYRFKDSLILSVREKENNARLETCEIDLKEKKIRQCYGMFDKFTEYHDDILKAVAKNIPVLLR